MRIKLPSVENRRRADTLTENPRCIPSNYFIWCAIEDFRAAGMRSTLWSRGSPGEEARERQRRGLVSFPFHVSLSYDLSNSRDKCLALFRPLLGCFVLFGNFCFYFRGSYVPTLAMKFGLRKKIQILFFPCNASLSHGLSNPWKNLVALVCSLFGCFLLFGDFWFCLWGRYVPSLAIKFGLRKTNLFCFSIWCVSFKPGKKCLSCLIPSLIWVFSSFRWSVFQCFLLGRHMGWVEKVIN